MQIERRGEASPLLGNNLGGTLLFELAEHALLDKAEWNRNRIVWIAPADWLVVTGQRVG